MEIGRLTSATQLAYVAADQQPMYRLAALPLQCWRYVAQGSTPIRLLQTSRPAVKFPRPEVYGSAKRKFDRRRHEGSSSSGFAPLYRIVINDDGGDVRPARGRARGLISSGVAVRTSCMLTSNVMVCPAEAMISIDRDRVPLTILVTVYTSWLATHWRPGSLAPHFHFRRLKRATAAPFAPAAHRAPPKASAGCNVTSDV